MKRRMAGGLCVLALTLGLGVGVASGQCVVDEDCDDINVCTYDECMEGLCSNTPRLYGDVDGNGLYDVAGNVWEWCNDWYDPAYYSVSPPDNPRGPATGTLRVHRGGPWSYYDYSLRCANRARGIPGNRYDNLGFRLALDVQ